MAVLTTKAQLVGDMLVLVPATTADREKIKPRWVGRLLRTEITRPRSRKHENWFRELCRFVGDAVGRHEGTIYAYLKFEAGKVAGIYDTPKGVMVELKSATKMSDEEYRDLTDTAIEVIFRDFVPGVDRKGFFEQLEARVGPRPV